MKILLTKFAALVATSGATFEHVSSAFAKHLPHQHAFSSQRFRHDQADGMIGTGKIVANDGIFFAKERAATYAAKNATAVAYPVSGDTIAMCEWPTQGRIRRISVTATTAEMDPASFGLDYFDADTAAAFPAFTLVAMDPNDATFTPIPLIEDRTLTDSGTDTITEKQISLAALAFGVNRRKDPLVVAVVLGGNVIANSGIAVHVDYVVPD